MEYFSDLKAKLIYVFRIPDAAHRDCVKIGEATFDDGDITLPPNSSVLNKAAKERIDQYTKTAGIAYDLLHTEIALFSREGKLRSINDKEVHEVLLRSGVKRKEFPHVTGANEWFVCDLETAKQAIAAAKSGKKALHTSQITQGQSPIQFRPEQCEAIDKTLKRFKKGKQMLWNAKMRFGKTLSALQVVKEHGGFKRVLILTHRPVVDAGWFEDFGKIFYDTPDFSYGSKTNGDTFRSLENGCKKGECRYVYFASMQDLRGSELVGGNFDKNDEIFSTPWDLIIVDEAHEGTQTELGQNVLKELVKEETKVLKLSGTPFNLLDDYTEDEIYTWDYVMEQRAKTQWDIDHPGDHNPYAGLPRLNIYTYDLGRLMNEYADEDIAFNFREFFRTNDDGEFIHKQHVENFLNLLTKTDEESMYPFANRRYRDIFRHTLWMVPGVKSAKALSTMLKNHPVFGMFEIVNVAGDGDEEESHDEALKKVEKAIGKDPDQTRTITLSCGRLTTGVSVKPWTGVFMLSGSFNTAASAYMQTIFRVQTPATINGKVKEDCYVFDFAPDRTLKVLAETAKISKKAGKQSSDDRKQLGEFLNFCPIISVEGSQMKQLDTEHMLQQLKKVYVERVVQNGFEDGYLYNDELMKLSDLDIKEFDELKGIIGQTKAMGKTNDITVNDQGLTNEEYAEKEKLEKKKKKELTEEEKARIEELKKKQKVKQDAISILRGISIRMPLLIYGADITDEDKELTIDNFTQLVDAQSWEEFMPKGVSKQRFNAFKKYYDPDIFTAAAKRIRQMARAADNLTVEERIERIASIFNTFRNPDKETVLTPWRVVNMHMSDTLGGYTFFNEDFSETIEEPRFVEQKDVTEDVFSTDSHLLEINSKSGLYPLYLAYNIYRSRLKNAMFSPETLEEHLAIWDAAIAENIFVICKTPMAKAITRRTLLGFRKGKTNMWAPGPAKNEESNAHSNYLINLIKFKPEHFIERVQKFVGKDVKIKAIVGNPPYQEVDGGGGSSAKPIYDKFVNMASCVNPCYVSMIMPSRWMTGGKGLDDFRLSMLANHNIRILHDYLDASDCFNNVSIEGGICYFLIDTQTEGKCLFVSHTSNGVSSIERYLDDNDSDVVVRDSGALSILSKVIDKTKHYFSEKVQPRNPFGLSNVESQISLLPLVNGIKLFGRFDGGRETRYLPATFVPPKGKDIFNSWKVFLSKADGAAGQLGNPIPARIIGQGVVGDTKTICTETFLAIAPFSSEEEVINVVTYCKTKFFRFMVGIRKLKNMTRDTYKFVPLQNFTSGSDIDWEAPIEQIDAALYAKYNLSDEEIIFIESMIKPM
ncbi:MAG: Eco57I restriction-modification methylase domain-containing protein [Muribaculaceae bacterium]|nr:Eco57I restriction-modification methylase domain-containing protein [Muribaculaceae bacterium]